MRDFKKLAVWQKTHEFVLSTYRATSDFPKEERFGLTVHVQKTVTSIGSNIAEGCGRDSDADLARFLSIAAGSASEAEYQLLLAFDLGYLPNKTFDDLTERVREIRRMLFGFKRSLAEGKPDS